MTRTEDTMLQSESLPPVTTARPRPPKQNLSAPRDPQSRLVSKILALAGPDSQLLSVHSRPWASATFIGAQHVLKLEIRENAGGEGAEAFARALPEAELSIPGHILADITTDSRESACHDGQCRTIFRLTALTIEDW